MPSLELSLDFIMDVLLDEGARLRPARWAPHASGHLHRALDPVGVVGGNQDRPHGGSRSLGRKWPGKMIGAAFIRFVPASGILFEHSRFNKRRVDVPVSDTLELSEALLCDLDRSLTRRCRRDYDRALAGGRCAVPASKTVHEANAIGAIHIAIGMGGTTRCFLQVPEDLAGLIELRERPLQDVSGRRRVMRRAPRRGLRRLDVIPCSCQPLAQLMQQGDVPALFVSPLFHRPRLAWLRSTRSASTSSFFAVRNRASQMAGLPARSAKSRYQQASSRSFDGLVSIGSLCMEFILRA